jgi:hypothetical protein
MGNGSDFSVRKTGTEPRAIAHIETRTEPVFHSRKSRRAGSAHSSIARSVDAASVDENRPGSVSAPWVR